MKMDFSGQTVIVTGAGQGIGRAIANVFAKRGANLVINGRTKSKLDEVEGELKALGARVVSLVADVSKREDCAATVAAAEKEFGRIDVLINNAQAGSEPGLTLLNLTDEKLDLVFGTGARGTLYMMQACHPIMKRGGGGSIVNFGSSTGIGGDYGFGGYVMTKEAIRGLTRVAANEWGPDNIRVNVICPASLSEGAIQYSKNHPDAYARVMKEIPLGRMGDSEIDIAGAVAALASPDFQYMSGCTLMLDGGRIRRP